MLFFSPNNNYIDTTLQEVHMKKTHKMRNEDNLRKCIAFAIPKVLFALMNNKVDGIRHVLPAFTLHVYTKNSKVKDSDIYPFFVADRLVDRGKKRVYVNESGQCISYIRRKNLKRFKNEIAQFVKNVLQTEFNSEVEQISNKMMDEFSDKWVITNGRPDFTSFKNFILRIIGFQSDSNKSNTPLVDSGYTPFSQSANHDWHRKMMANSAEFGVFDQNSMYSIVELDRYNRLDF